MPDARSLADLMRIRAHNRDLLDSFNGSLGTALGFKKRTNEPLSRDPAVIVFVPEKINPKWLPGSQVLPKRLDGPDNLSCPLDVVEGSQATDEDPVPRAESSLAERLRGWDDQIWAGSQIGHWTNQSTGRYSVGTLGAFAVRRGTRDLGLLTNKHVAIQQGQKLFHPVPWGTHFATTESVLEFVRDDQWYGPFVDEPNTIVRVDCGFAKIVDGFDSDLINTDLMGVGPLGKPRDISLDEMSIIGQKVVRVGRTTGLRTGSVVAFGYEFRDENDLTVYTDLLIIGDDGVPFSTHGDSGSLIVTNDDARAPVGLLWGGWQERLRTGHGQENWTYGIALTHILDFLDIDLVTGD